ncbi:thiamine biosynthesis protein ThiF [Candidatus Omnitrophus magneticus]|uniref:Thiamine biosynthesis protein ThiF n=1 Tax=Candidatus Omnitrophus magneticus TaxID=1609969 RepID=A0A0F0CPD1_9BACT|nr:thiamine biosynthesis protein ThiF [Candidatus Omnitrophus magneticus]
MNEFEKSILKYVGENNFKKIQSAEIGIAGAGGLGSNCAHILARTGFKKFTIIDFDVITYSNLNRQFYFYDEAGKIKIEVLSETLKRINPDIEITAIQKKIEPSNIKSIFKNCDIIVEALDKAEAKAFLIENLACHGRFMVSVSGVAGFGLSDEIKTYRLNSNLVVIGDLKSDTENSPPMAPRVIIAAAKQAETVISYVLSR